ncbi:MAG: ABC transporter ATP-binding protein [Candidatus Bipolaricaulia bacterium]
MNSSRNRKTELLAVENLHKSFGELKVLKGIKFEINTSGFVTFLGPSGCGKSTLFKIVLELLSPDSGRIDRGYRSSGYLPQEGLLFPWKNVMENIELPLELKGVGKKERRKRVRENLEDFGLSGFEEAYPHQLSGGMRQRAALLRTILTDAPVLFLDEPFGSLDALTRDRIQRWLLDLLSDLNRTILFITHDLEEGLFLSEKIIVLSDRPATVRGEFPVDLDEEERDKTGQTFFDYKRELIKIIEEVDKSNEGETVRQLLG